MPPAVTIPLRSTSIPSVLRAPVSASLPPPVPLMVTSPPDEVTVAPWPSTMTPTWLAVGSSRPTR